MKLLIDAVMVRSPGLIQLCRELSSAIEKTAPDECDAVLLTTPGVYEKSMFNHLSVITMNSPTGGWVGRWYWYNIMLPKIARKYNADVLYSLSGILSESLYKSLGVVNSINNMVPFEPTMMGKGCLFFSRVYLRNFVLRSLYTRSLRIADAVVFHSRHALNMITKHTGDISAKALVMLTGVPYDVRNWSVDLRPHPNGGNPYFLYLSVIRSYKNHLRLVEAYRRALKIESNLPDLLLAGIAEENDCLDEIISTIKKNDLEKKIRYIGVLKRDDIPGWLYYADVNLFPSLCETNSVVLSEIMGLGGVLPAQVLRQCRR